MAAPANNCKYSCENATQTLEWIKDIAHFIKPYSFLIDAHVVNFFKGKLWEAVDREWIDCLRNQPLQNLLLIPSGFIQDDWPVSLKEFIVTVRSLVFHREQADLRMVLPGLNITSLNKVLAQGMSLKKKHEVEVLSAVVNSIANSVKADTIVDVGAGQGYLSQVLSFQYQHSVVAIDANDHHGRVTDARAERIKKHYAAQMRKLGSGKKCLNVPKTITCNVMSIDTLKSLTNMSNKAAELLKPNFPSDEEHDERRLESSCNADCETSLVLAGLHACGDLSVTMLRTFVECKDVKAVVSIGCCYHLLSEEGSGVIGSQCGFPMSCGVKNTGISLGRSSRDLSCQSAERWRSLRVDAGLQNFEMLAFRAAFQMVLGKYYPDIMITSPTIGRQGKALRRQQQRRILESPLHSSVPQDSNMEANCTTVEPTKSKTGFVLDMDALSDGMSSDRSFGYGCKAMVPHDKYSLFEIFSQSGLCRLGLKPLPQISFQGIWNQAEPFSDLIGPYWSLRAALGPLLETFLLLDRLLFLQEQGNSLKAVMLPIFDPALSPRNVAIIAKKI
ncbi:Methyltransf_32 domain-containing protein [Cephalotus follicularis]|uniref:Methyltransf_32 domain-containing protein n=1 Tax=Cephalotus follicularis TaxID=3775 RepID=A0A1Q3C3S9_CEPFO|nr:Methyltransf_32 domain-containing protein [Cephalotus follicularis]